MRIRLSPACSVLAFVAWTALGADPIGSISEVRVLTPVEAAKEQPVSLEAVVTYPDIQRGGVFIHDGRAGIYLLFPVGLRTNSNTKILTGERLQVRAVTTPGNYLPALICKEFSSLGLDSVPKPIKVDEQNLFSPDLDCQWVTVSGVLVSAESGKEGQTVLAMELYGWTFKILLPDPSEGAQEFQRFMQQHVRLRAVAATVYNEQRQMTGRYFLMPTPDFMELLGPPQDSETAALLSPDELLRSDTTGENLVRVRGVVTYAGENDLCLRGEGGSLRVYATGASSFSPGDKIEAEGFPSIAPFRPVLRARKITVLGHTFSPEPVKFDPIPAQLSRYPAELVEVEAEFLGRRESPDVHVLQCKAQSVFFEAWLSSRYQVPEGLVPGCRVRLVGNCELTTTHPLPRSEWVDGFRIQLRSENDVEIMVLPPWWTTERLLAALGMGAGLGLVAAIWIWQLRRRVSAQTEFIGKQIEQQAVLSERHRIARELHDTLEQELTGVAIQLRNVQQSLEKEPIKARESLTLAQQMLRYSRDEARTSIRDLRSVLLEQRGLVGAMEETLPPLVANEATRFELVAEGTPRRLEATMENHLLRVAQEAVANASHHAQANLIKVCVTYSEQALGLEIRDDGRGFDTTKGPPRGHFGLLGMQERANKLNSELQVLSQPGKGTIVKITVALDEPTVAASHPLPQTA